MISKIKIQIKIGLISVICWMHPFNHSSPRMQTPKNHYLIKIQSIRNKPETLKEILKEQSIHLPQTRGEPKQAQFEKMQIYNSKGSPLFV